MIIDATDLIVGRIAAFAAKQALLGKKVDIVNCENAIISGNIDQITKRYKQKVSFGGPHNGPFVPKVPDRYLRRVVRGMLPYKQEKGKSALKRVMCYLSVPEELKDKKLETIKEASFKKLPYAKYIKLSDLMKKLKG